MIEFVNIIFVLKSYPAKIEVMHTAEPTAIPASSPICNHWNIYIWLNVMILNKRKENKVLLLAYTLRTLWIRWRVEDTLVSELIMSKIHTKFMLTNANVTHYCVLNKCLKFCVPRIIEKIRRLWLTSHINACLKACIKDSYTKKMTRS